MKKEESVVDIFFPDNEKLNYDKPSEMAIISLNQLMVYLQSAIKILAANPATATAMASKFKTETIDKVSEMASIHFCSVREQLELHRNGVKDESETE